MPDRRASKNRRLTRRNLAFETLDRRELLATLTVGNGGQFASIQAAVNNAAPGDIIQLAATTAETGFAESVNLSLMGSARPGGVMTGDLTIRGDSAGEGTLIVPLGNSGTNNSAFYNTQPFTGNITLSNLTLRPAVATPLEDKGIRLDSVTGNVTISQVQIFDAADAAIEITNSGGAAGTQSRLTIKDVNIGRNLDGITPLGIVLSNLRMLGSIDTVSISEVGDIGLRVETTGTTSTSLTMRDVDFKGWNENFAGNDGLVMTSSGASSLIVNVSFSDFTDLPGNSIDAESRDTSQLLINVYGDSAFTNADPSLVRKTVPSTTINEPANRFVSRQSSKMSVAFDHNIINEIDADAIQVQALDTSVMNVNVHDNIVSSIGSQEGHNVVWIGGNPMLSAQANASNNATINATIAKNTVLDSYAAAFAVRGDGSSTYNISIQDNPIGYGDEHLSGIAAIRIVGVQSMPAKFNLSITGNAVDVTGNMDAVRIDMISAAATLRYEMTHTNIITALRATNFLGENSSLVNVRVFTADHTTLRVSPGTFAPRFPVRLGDTIWADTNRNGIQDNKEDSVAGALLTLTGTESFTGRSVSYAVLSDADKGYLFGALLPGMYTLKLRAPDGLDVTVPNRTTPATNDIDDELDSDFPEDTRQVTINLTADNTSIDAGLVPGSAWKNPNISQDVNGDGAVAPLDALLVIIDLNSMGPRTLPALSPGVKPPNYLDVSGDGSVAPLDALLVIIRLNAGAQAEPPIDAFAGAPQSTSAAPQGESSAAYYVPPEFFYVQSSVNQSADDADEDTNAIDAYFADWQ